MSFINPPYAIPSFVTTSTLNYTQLTNYTPITPVLVNFYVLTTIFPTIFYDSLANGPCYYKYKSPHGYYSVFNDPLSQTNANPMEIWTNVIAIPDPSVTLVSGTLAYNLANLNTIVASLQTSRTADETTLASLNTNVTSLLTSRTADETTLVSLNTSVISLQTSRTADEATLTSLSTSVTAVNTSVTSLLASRTADELTIAALQNQIATLGSILVNFGLATSSGTPAVYTAVGGVQNVGQLTTSSASITTLATNIGYLKTDFNTAISTINSNSTAYNNLNTLNLTVSKPLMNASIIGVTQF